MLISSPNPEELSPFIGFVHTNVSKELSLLHDLPHKVFQDRSRIIPVAQDIASEEARLLHCLAQGTKEHLVSSPYEFPGVTGVHALERGVKLQGLWFDRTAEYYAKRKGRDHDMGEFATRYSVTFSPLPTWEPLCVEEWRARVTGIVKTIEEAAAQERGELGIEPLGAEAVLARSPTSRQPHQKRSPAPIALAATRSAFLALKARLVAFATSFFEKSKQLREGEVNVEFPLFSYPPGQPMRIHVRARANGPPLNSLLLN